MPTFLRRYYIAKISEENRKKQEEIDKKTHTMRSSDDGKIHPGPKISSPTYKTRAGKK